MPQELEANFPHVTAEQWADMEAPREILAARLVVSRHITGIPKRAYLTGTADNAPVVRGVADLAAAAYALLDVTPGAGMTNSQAIAHANLTAILETFDHV
jgi:hypothetical protein